jgi:hypothetical protein
VRSNPAYTFFLCHPLLPHIKAFAMKLARLLSDVEHVDGLSRRTRGCSTTKREKHTYRNRLVIRSMHDATTLIPGFGPAPQTRA